MLPPALRLSLSKFTSLGLLVALGSLALLNACASLPGLANPTPAALLASPTSTATLELPGETQAEAPTSGLADTPAPPDTLPATETLPTLSSDQAQATQTGEAILSSVQTQFALLQNPPTATPCPSNGPCYTATPTRTPRYTATPTYTPTPQLPLAYLRILSPGSLSKVTSPISLEASVIPGAKNIVKVELIGENGRVITRQVLDYGMPKGARFGINPKIDFEIPGAAEAARLQISVEDTAGRPIALSSVELVLLSVGEDEINPAPEPLEPFDIQSPAENQTVTGGHLIVTGEARPLNDQPLVFEVLNDQGAIIASRMASVPMASGETDYSFFAVDIPYTVSAPTNVRLLVRQPDDPITGNAAISSELLTLAP